MFRRSCLNILVFLVSPCILCNADVDVTDANSLPGERNGVLHKQKPNAEVMVYARSFNSDYLNDTTIRLALDAIGNQARTLLLADGTWNIRDSIVIPSNVKLRLSAAAELDISAGNNVTINGLLDAGLRQIFSGKGACIFGKESATEVYPQWWGAKADGINVDTSSIQSALDSIVDGGICWLSKGIYLHDGEPIIVRSNVEIKGEDATIRLKKGKYRKSLMFFQTKGATGGSYDSKVPVTANIAFSGIVLDGNNQEIVTNFSCTGFNLFRVNNASITNCKIFNLPGKIGGGYGIIAWYSDGVLIESVKIDWTDRQNICIWETTNAVIRDCELSRSCFRDNILVSNNMPHSLQGSYCIIENTKCFNGTGTHVIRFSGSGSGIVKGCTLQSEGNLEGIYICSPAYKEIAIENNRINNCKYGILVESDTEKKIDIKNNVFKKNINDIRINSAGGDIGIYGNKTENTKRQPLYVNGPNNVVCANNVFNSGGGLYLSVRKELAFEGNTVTGNTGKYSVVISSSSNESFSSISNNTLVDNKNDSMRVYTKYSSSGNDGKIVADKDKRISTKNPQSD